MNKPPKTREELALGVLNPRTGKRDKGYLNMLHVMKQNREKIALGELAEEDLVERAFVMADKEIARREAGPGEDPINQDEVDSAYREEQETAYRKQYDWGDDNTNANDEASLQMILDIEIEQRRLQRQMRRVKIDWKERTELLGEMRQLATTHASLQKSLGIDRTARDQQRRTADPMAVLKEQIIAGAAQMQSLLDGWAEVAPTIQSEASLRYLSKHHAGLPYGFIDPLLKAHRRVLGLPEDLQLD